MRVLTSILLFLFIISGVNASEIVHEFGSPSFSGVGKSSHYLTIENIEKTRKNQENSNFRIYEKSKRKTLSADPILNRTAEPPFFKGPSAQLREQNP